MDASELKMPALERGRIYRREDLVGEICVDSEGTNDWNLVTVNFPFQISGPFQHDALNSRLDEQMLVQYDVLPLSEFETQLQALEDSYRKDDELRENGTAPSCIGFRPEKDEDRIQRVLEKLARGETIYSVFIQQNDPQRRIIEGRHRAVALRRLRWGQLPVLLVGYRDWFVS
jgi:hypothetical protein